MLAVTIVQYRQLDKRPNKLLCNNLFLLLVYKNQIYQLMIGFADNIKRNIYMANSLLTITMITREAVRLWKNTNAL